MMNEQFISNIRHCVFKLNVLIRIHLLIFQTCQIKLPVQFLQVVHTSHACLQGHPPPTQPSNNIVSKSGFNLVTLFLAMAASLVENPLFADQLWLEGSQLVPGVQVLSGPFDRKSFSTSSSLAGFPNFHLPSYNHTKCHPGQPLPEPDLESIHTGILIAQDHMNSQPDLSDVDFQ